MIDWMKTTNTTDMQNRPHKRDRSELELVSVASACRPAWDRGDRLHGRVQLWEVSLEVPLLHVFHPSIITSG